MNSVFYTKKAFTNQSQVYNEITTIETRASINSSQSQDNDTDSELINKNVVEFIDGLKVGHMVPLTCGHNGTFNFTEYENYRYHLRNANFIEA